MSPDLPRDARTRAAAPVRGVAARVALVAALALAALLPPPAIHAAGGPPCTGADGQALIDAGRYEAAIRVFSCLIEAEPAEIDGYRGRIEAELLLGRYADAMADYNRVTVSVLPAHPDAEASIVDAYAARLAVAPTDIPALTGASFAYWWMFDYPHAIQLLNVLVDERPDDVYGSLFRGSSRLLHGGPRTAGTADLERAVRLAPGSADVRWVVADAFTYGLADPERALTEASRALAWGLDTPRVHAILGAAHNALGDVATAALHIDRHIDLVTTELVTAPALEAGGSLRLGLVPGRTYAIPLPVTVGEVVSFAASSREYWDSIAVLLAPDGSPILGSDDDSGYHAAFEWVAPATGTYWLHATFFESITTGMLIVSRD